MSPAAEKPSKITERTVVSLQFLIAVLVPAFGTILWLQSRLQGIEHALQSVQDTQAQIRRELQNGHSNFVTWREMQSWVEINRAKGIDLEKLPPH